MHTFKENDILLMYDSKFEKFLGKFIMDWLGPYVVVMTLKLREVLYVRLGNTTIENALAILVAHRT